MTISGVEATPQGDRDFRTVGFAVAAGGVGQRFFEKLEEEGEHTAKNIVSIAARTVTSVPLAYSPLGMLPGVTERMRGYAKDMFNPTVCRITVDGRVLPWTEYTGVNIASMSINLGGVFRFFNIADEPGQMHCMAGSPTPFEVVSRVPKMMAGARLTASRLFDGPCREMKMEATSDELLAPVIDGEWYDKVREVTFKLGPRVRIPKVVGRSYRN